MFDHVTIRVADRAASERFSTTVLATLGIEPSLSGDDFVEWDDFSLAQAAAVDAFHRVATAARYRDHGAPGERPEYHAGCYGADVRDPDGHNVEVVHHDRG